MELSDKSGRLPAAGAGLSRRDFLRLAGAVAAAGLLPAIGARAAAAAARPGGLTAAAAKPSGSAAGAERMSDERFFQFWQKAKTEAFRRRRPFYPAYHLATPFGWMNDPNGLIYYKGQYHAFYQHHPYEPKWGPMHWGHAVSRDMVHWRHLPPALRPGADGPDKDGCFSGSAIAADGKLWLIYSGNVWMPGGLDIKGERSLLQVQCLAGSEDGIHFTKYGEVLAPPPGVTHFRDPKVWRQDGRYYMVLGVRSKEFDGQIRLYHSADLRHWQFESILDRSNGKLGYMWECPDLYSLGNQQMLSFSPQGCQQHDGYTHRNLYSCGVISGHWQPGQPFTASAPFAELDHGHDYYAANSFIAADGRRIAMAWMNMWKTPQPTEAEGWAGCLTLPRELSLDAAGRLRQRPIAELQSLRGAESAIERRSLDNERRQIADKITAHELILRWNRKNTTAERYGLRLGQGLAVYWDTQSEMLTLERDYPAGRLSGSRSAALLPADILELHIYFDHSSIEVFANDGEETITSRIYPDENDRIPYIFADAGKAELLGGEIWPLKSISAAA